MSARVRIAISACLLGQEVRYDGCHRHNAYITGTLGELFEFVPYCPEVAIGMGIPRPPIRLVQVGRAVHARGVDDPTQDVTEPLLGYADMVAKKLNNVGGYIFKKNSPSCGPARVKLYTRQGRRAGTARGIYAGRLQDLHPAMPVVDEEQLLNPKMRDRFLMRVFVYHRWQQLNRRPLTARRLAAFHASVQSVPGRKTRRALDRLVAAAAHGNPAKAGQRYIQQLMWVLGGARRPGGLSTVW